MSLFEEPVSEAGRFFQIELEFTLTASCEAVFKALTQDVDRWWVFRVVEGISVMRLDPKVGGLFAEENASGDGRLWGTVEFIERNRRLRLRGPLGMNTAVDSVYSFMLQPHEGATLLQIEHRAIGDIAHDMGQAHHDGWISLVIEHLKPFVERETAAPPSL
jgi:uncharacterized protein YndB with AHSA1/START domain